MAPGIPPAIEAATMRALARSPDDRFPTAAAFAAAIEATGLPIASARAVAAFVTELGVHVPAPNNLARPVPPNARASRSGVSNDRLAGLSERPPPPEAPPEPSPPEPSLPPSINPTARTDRTDPPRRGRAALTAGAGIAIVLAAAALVALRSGGQAPTAAAGAAVKSEAISASPPAAPTPPPSATAPPAASTASLPIEAPASAAPPRAAPRTARSASKPDAKPDDKQPPASSTSWRPAAL